jgi:glutathione peroxidase
MSKLSDFSATRLMGGPEPLSDFEGKVTLVVNVARHCGNTHQYEGLEALYEKYGKDGLVVMGFPCNQFDGQEPGTAEEIAEFCSTTYGVTFPMTEKVEVNGEHRHPLYARLVGAPDAGGYTGDIRWNFEKFLVTPGGEVRARFSPQVTPEDGTLVGAIEAALPR